MTNEISPWDTLLNEIFKYKQDINNLENVFKESNETLLAQISNQNNEIKLLKDELNITKELIDKNKKYFLFLLESGLDKQNESINLQNDKISSLNEQFIQVKNINSEKDDKISILNEDIGKFKVILNEKNNQINSLNEVISSKDEIINSLNEKINEISILELNLREKDSTINSLNKEITLLKYTIEEKDKTINSLK